MKLSVVFYSPRDSPEKDFNLFNLQPREERCVKIHCSCLMELFVMIVNTSRLPDKGNQ